MALRRLRLAERRKARGYTQEDLAGRLGCDRSTVIRWEHAQTDPQPWQRPALARALQVTPGELATLLQDVTQVPGRADRASLITSVPLDFSLSSAYTVRVMEGFSARDIASRRQALADITVITGAVLLRPVRQWAASLALDPGQVASAGPDEVSELEQAVTTFRRWDASGAGGLRRKAVAGQLNAVAETLRDPHPAASARRLFGVTGELAQLAGWMAYDAGLHGAAQQYYIIGLHACREAGNPGLGAKIIGDMTQLSTALGHYADSLSLVRAALSALPPQAGSLVRCELLGLEARASAHLGPSEAGNADRAAQHCVALFAETAGHEPAPDWIHYMGQAETHCLAANVYIQLALTSTASQHRRHYAQRAETHVQCARQARGGGYVRSRVLDEIRLARVRLAQDEPAEAAAAGIRAIHLAAGTRSAVVLDWLTQFGHDLPARYPGGCEAASFDGELRDYLRQAAPTRLGDLP